MLFNVKNLSKRIFCQNGSSFVVQKVKELALPNCGAGNNYSTGWIPDLGTSTCHGHGQKKKKKERLFCQNGATDWSSYNYKINIKCKHISDLQEVIVGLISTYFTFLISMVNNYLKKFWGVPITTQWKWICLVPMRTQVWSLASLTGFRIWHCRELWCKSQTWHGSGIAVAVA